MIISNTTPISNFLNLGQLNLLKQLLEKIHIPQAVFQEIDTHFSENEEWQQALQKNFIIVHQIKEHKYSNHFFANLHSGEAEALCLYLEKNAQICLLDDKDARSYAEIHNIKITGTLGLLIQAKKKGYIQSVKLSMNELKHYHFWINEAMYNKVLSLSGEL